MPNASQGSPSARWMFWLLTVGLAAAATLVVMLGVRVEVLERRTGELLRAGWFPEVGMYVPAFTEKDQLGVPAYVGGSQDGSPQLLIILSFACEFSDRSRPAWSALVQSNRNASIVGVSVDENAEAVGRGSYGELDFPVVTFPDQKLHWFYRTGITPQVLLLRHDGRVLFHRAGDLTVGPALDSIRVQLEAASM
jgi:hypothetical protein